MRAGLCWTAVALVVALSCGRQIRQSGVQTGDGDDSSAVADGAAPGRAGLPVLFDGFETDSVAGFWRPGDYGSGRYEAGAITISRAFVRTGLGSVRITIREGDIEQHGDSGQLTERAELDSGKFPLMNRDMWYGFSFLIPSDFPIVDRRLVIAQWKQSGLPGSPLVAQRFRGGRHHLTIRAAGFMGRGAGRHFELPGITAGQWHDMVYHIRFSPDGDGVVEVWMNGARAVVYEGATAMPGGSEIYNKIGLYRDRWKDPMTIYFDDYRLGGSSVDVSPH